MGDVELMINPPFHEVLVPTRRIGPSAPPTSPPLALERRGVRSRDAHVRASRLRSEPPRISASLRDRRGRRPRVDPRKQQTRCAAQHRPPASCPSCARVARRIEGPANEPKREALHHPRERRAARSITSAEGAARSASRLRCISSASTHRRPARARASSRSSALTTGRSGAPVRGRSGRRSGTSLSALGRSPLALSTSLDVEFSAAIDASAWGRIPSPALRKLGFSGLWRFRRRRSPRTGQHLGYVVAVPDLAHLRVV